MLDDCASCYSTKICSILSSSSLVDHFVNAMRCWYISWRHGQRSGGFSSIATISEPTARSYWSFNDLWFFRMALNDPFRTGHTKYEYICAMNEVDRIKRALDQSRYTIVVRNHEWYYSRECCNYIMLAINRLHFSPAVAIYETTLHTDMTKIRQTE